MTEKQGVYETAAEQLAEAGYIEEAVEMLGAGYETPAIEIEKSRTVIERRSGKMQEVDRPAFVKLSTAFKLELSQISGDALKVWLFVALSINRKTCKANPGLRTIAAGVNISVNTVQKALQELETLELLTVDRESRKYNIYETPDYVSANKTEPTVSNRDTDEKTVSKSAQTVSNFLQSVSPAVILNQSNQSNQNDRYTKISRALAELKGGALNSLDADFINTWLTKHENKWILQALAETQARGAKSTNYTDRILVGWEANGYPKTRDEQVAERKTYGHQTGNSQSARPKQQRQNAYEYTDADRAAAALINGSV